MSDGQPGGMNPALKIILGVAGVLLLLTCGGVALVAWFVTGSVERFESTAAVAPTMTRMRSIESAIAAYRVDNRMLPENLDALAGPGGMLDADEVPTDAWGNPFVYEPLGETEYTLVSFGSDGVEGGEGDAADITRKDLEER